MELFEQKFDGFLKGKLHALAHTFTFCVNEYSYCPICIFWDWSLSRTESVLFNSIWVYHLSSQFTWSYTENMKNSLQ